MPPESEIQLLDLVFCLSDAMDFIDPLVVSHHKQVAYIALCIGEELGLPDDLRKDLLIAGGLHDIGAFSLKDRKEALSFELLRSGDHAGHGYALLSLLKPLSGIATIVKYHHTDWDYGRGAEYGQEHVPFLSHILYLADRISVLVDRRREVLGQSAKISRKIRQLSGSSFHPLTVEAFLDLADRECFWLDLLSPSIETVLSRKVRFAGIGLDSEDMLGFSRLFSRIIDFKSPFTATHSTGVSISAEILSGHFGFSDSDRFHMRIAGYLHDLGKLAVPVEILNKPAKLRKGEMRMVKHHAFYTYRLLERVPSLVTINQWASYHHERLDGTGYPFHLKGGDLPAGSQIMSVADVFTALSEDRPYRKGMSKEDALKAMDGMASCSMLNGDILSVLKANYDEIAPALANAQAAATREYGGVLRMS